jgi:signal transduction histidine kinase
MTDEGDIDSTREEPVLHQLRRADRFSTLGALASIVAHELGTPLNVVSGRAALIANDPDASDKVKKNAAVIVKQARAMATLIQRILDASAPDEAEGSSAACPISRVLERAIEVTGPQAMHKGVLVVVEGEAASAVSLGEARSLQVTTALLSRAITQTDSGGTIRVRVDTEEIARPKDPRCQPGTYVTVEVLDGGEPSTKEQLDLLFKPFYKTESNLIDIGLIMVRDALRGRGGFIEAAHAPEGGNAFKLHLPTG